MKVKYLTFFALPALLLPVTLAAVLMVTPAAHAGGKGDDVFLDEGDGDFGSVPVPSNNGQKTEKVGKSEKAAAAPAPEHEAAAPEALPSLEDGAAPVAPAAPVAADTVEPAAPAPAEEQTPEAVEPKAPKKSHAKHAVQAAKDTDHDDAEAPAPVPKQAKASAAKNPGKFMTTKDSCPMLREPASEGPPMIVVKPARKIWVEMVDDNWVRGFNRAGEAGYLNKSCFD